MSKDWKELESTMKAGFEEMKSIMNAGFKELTDEIRHLKVSIKLFPSHNMHY